MSWSKPIILGPTYSTFEDQYAPIGCHRKLLRTKRILNYYSYNDINAWSILPRISLVTFTILIMRDLLQYILSSRSHFVAFVATLDVDDSDLDKTNRVVLVIIIHS